jgi:hypothetical protein
MKFKNLVLLNSLIVFLFGAAFMIRPFGPSGMTALYGVVQNSWGVIGLLASTLVGFGIVLSSVAYTVPEERQQLVTVALLLANLLAFAISASQAQAIFNTSMAWVTAGVYLMLALGYGYLVVKGKSARHAAHRA